MLARWHRSAGHDAEAIALLKGTMKIGFDLLSDEDERNDWQRYYRLGTVLMYYGDAEQALAAWSLVGPQGNDNEEDNDEETQANSTAHDLTDGDANSAKDDSASTHSSDGVQGILGEEEELDDGGGDDDEEEEQQTGLSLECDGACGFEWSSADNMWMCMDCLDVAFNEDCLKLLRSGELPTNVCNPKHEFLHIPPWG